MVPTAGGEGRVRNGPVSVFSLLSVSYGTMFHLIEQVTCPQKIAPDYKLGLGYNDGSYCEGSWDVSEAIYDGTNYRVTSGGGCKGFAGQERRADVPRDRDNGTDLLQMAP